MWNDVAQILNRFILMEYDLYKDNTYIFLIDNVKWFVVLVIHYRT
jgi:hypothetical protein